jgi:transposase-like protein
MKRQKFSREYKLEAVKQVRERGVSSEVAQGFGRTRKCFHYVSSRTRSGMIWHDLETEVSALTF